ncbi:MAG: hypothetical protein ACI8Z1_003124 [Candidatus Azotimanducaceae bacterium]|jgi:hypothetical protein
MTKKINTSLILAMSLFVSTLFLSTHSSAAFLSVDTDTTWKANNTVQAGWTNFLFDDSIWRSAHAVYSGLASATGARIIWDHPDPFITNPGEPSLPNEAWFRHRFQLEDPIISAVMDFLVNDEIDIYINNTLVVNDRSNGSTVVQGINVAHFLGIGNNTIAVYAFDGGIIPFERGAAYFSIGLHIETVSAGVPTPHSIVVLLLGLFGLGAANLRTSIL